MRKIPTLFVRNEADRKHVTREVNPGCEWVLAGEGTPTRKYDGTCVLVLHGIAYARREVKDGKPAPADFQSVEHDEITGKTVGWEPANQSGFAKWIEAALWEGIPDGTYELCGPKVNGNPEGYDEHFLIEHAKALVLDDAPRDFDGLRDYLLANAYEGIVWHHPDGRMVKLKKRDFPRGQGERKAGDDG